jgi:hypothetical protein
VTGIYDVINTDDLMTGNDEKALNEVTDTDDDQILIKKTQAISTAIAVSAFADIMDPNTVNIVFFTTFKLT